SNISSDGYIDRASSHLRSFYFSTAYLSDKNDLRFNIFSGKEKTYQAWYGISEADLPVHRTINYAGTEKPGSPYDNETDNYRQDHYQLFFTHRFTTDLQMNLTGFLSNGQGYYEEYKANQDYASYGMDYPVVGNDTVMTTDLVRQLWLKNHFYGSVFSLQKKTQKSSWTFGGALTRYEGKHFGKIIWASEFLAGPHVYYDLDAFKHDANLYAKWQREITGDLSFFADLQYRRVNYHLNGFENNPTLFIDKIYDFFNPKIGLSYHRNNWLAYASYSVAQKEPNRDDFEAAINQQPNPEHLRDLELGIERKNSKTSWSADFYFMDYKNQLVLTGKINDVGAYTRTNIPKSYRAGVELQGSWMFAGWISASANLSLSRNKILNFTEYIDNYDNGTQKMNQYSKTDISFSPNAIGAATITLSPIHSFHIDLLSKYVGKQYLDNTSNASRMLHAYFTEDIRLIYSLQKSWLKNADIIFQVNNLFNRKYEPNGYTYSYYSNNQLTTENYYLPMAGTNWMMGINLKF
ncbi:MAG: TonB-dependent receptor, partial [Flavisolibacter sp.]